MLSKAEYEHLVKLGLVSLCVMFRKVRWPKWACMGVLMYYVIKCQNFHLERMDELTNLYTCTACFWIAGNSQVGSVNC